MSDTLDAAAVAELIADLRTSGREDGEATTELHRDAATALEALLTAAEQSVEAVARAERLENALRPFAEAASQTDPRTGTSTYPITVQHLVDARAALNGAPDAR